MGEMNGSSPCNLVIDVSADPSFGTRNLWLALDLRTTVEGVKDRLHHIGATIPKHKMKLNESFLGFLRDDRTLAFYNLNNGAMLTLSARVRGGRARRRDEGTQSAAMGFTIGAP